MAIRRLSSPLPPEGHTLWQEMIQLLGEMRRLIEMAESAGVDVSEYRQLAEMQAERVHQIGMTYWPDQMPSDTPTSSQ